MLKVGQEYKRTYLHSIFGGQVQSGISTPKAFPIILLFTGESGRDFGYEDESTSDGKKFLLYGEGQIGPQKFEKGNKAIRDHLKNGKILLLFKSTDKGYVEFVDQMEYKAHYFKDGHDREGNIRKMIVFVLLPLGKKTIVIPAGSLIATHGKRVRSPTRGSISRMLYRPTYYESELIARILDETRKVKFRTIPLPKIHMSDEPPPLFIENPRLDKDTAHFFGERENNEHLVPPRHRPLPEVGYLDIEMLFGCYLPREEIIILYQKGLEWAIDHYGFNLEIIRAIVLVHEIGHWITHLLPSGKVLFWPLNLFIQTTMDVHEGWAQLITYWITSDLGDPFLTTFNDLNVGQSTPYRIYKDFKGKPRDVMLASLEQLRALKSPADLAEWKRFV